MSAVPTPSPYHFTHAEYRRMGEMGFFEGRRVELIHREIVQMPAIREPHAVAVGLCEPQLRRAFDQGYWVRVQAPLRLHDDSEPEPDLAVVTGGPRDYLASHPTSTLLVVEVSDTALLYDQRVKSSLFAREDIQDYWVINLVSSVLEVYRRPVSDASRTFGYRYADVMQLKKPDVVAPLSAPSAIIHVSNLLP